MWIFARRSPPALNARRTGPVQRPFRYGTRGTIRPSRPDKKEPPGLAARGSIDRAVPIDLQLASALLAHHERVVVVLGDLRVEVVLVAERRDRIPDLLELGVRRRHLGIDLVGLVEAGREDLLAERTQLGAVRYQALDGGRVLVVVLLQHVRVGGLRGRAQQRLVGLRQLVVLGLVEEEVDGRTAFPPARIVVVRRNLLEAELLVVIRADPLGGVDGALLERRVDVAAGDLLRHDAELLDHLAGEAADAHLQALQIGDGVDLLAEPAAHLDARIAARQAEQALRAEELVEQVDAAAVVVPGVHAARVERERNRGAERPGRVLAPVVVSHRVARLDRARRRRVRSLQAGDDLARREGLDGKVAVGRFRDHLRQHLGAAIDGVERLRERRGHAPRHLGRRLGDGGGCKRRRGGCAGAGDAGLGDE